MAQKTISANLRLLNGRYVIPLHTQSVFSEINQPDSPLYTPYNFQWMLDDGQGKMRPIVDQSRDIIFGHFRELFLEDTFEACEDDKAIARAIIVDHAEFNFTTTFFEHGRLSWRQRHQR